MISSEAIARNNKADKTTLNQVLRSKAEKKEWNIIQAVTKPEKTGIITQVEVKHADESIMRCDTNNHARKRSMAKFNQDSCAPTMLPFAKKYYLIS